MIFGKSKKPNNQEAQGGANAPRQASYPYTGAQNAYPQGGFQQGYGAQGGAPRQGYTGYQPEQPGYSTPGVGGGYFSQGTAPQSYPGQLGQQSQGGGSMGYPQMNQGASYPQGYPQGNQAAPQGYAQGNQTAPQGYAQGNQAAPQGYAQGNQTAPQGYAQGNQAAPQGYAQGSQAAPQGYPQGYSQAGYPQMNPQGGYPQMNPQGSYGYPRQGGYPQMPPQNQGYPQGAGGNFAGYPQMGRAPQGAQEQPGRQIPLNGGGYVPPAQKVKRSLPFKNLYLLILCVVLLVLFIVGVAAVKPLLWIFAGLAIGSIAFFWVRPTIDTNKRLCFTIVFAALTVAAGVTLFAGGGAPGGDPTTTGTGNQATAVPGNQTSSGGTVVDPKTGQVLTTVDVSAATATPAPAADDHSATDRLESFFYYWSVNKQDDMLTLCAPSWLSTVENAKTALFGLMANRTPLDYTVEKISGTVDDTSRTVTVTSTMDRNNGKDPVKYRLGVLMVREGDQWYVDPQSLKSYEEAETQDPATLPTPTPTAEPAANASTILYYNPEGGSKYHLDQNCKSTHAKYLPMKGHFTYAEINDDAYKNLEPCNVCAAPLRP